MWLFTQYGFYSIVQDKNDAGKFHIRARDKGDLDRILEFSNQGRIPIIETPSNDYHFRIAVDQSQMDAIGYLLFGTIDYPNFKGRISELRSQKDRHNVYMDVWSHLRSWFTRKEMSRAIESPKRPMGCTREQAEAHSAARETMADFEMPQSKDTSFEGYQEYRKDSFIEFNPDDPL